MDRQSLQQSQEDAAEVDPGPAAAALGEGVPDLIMQGTLDQLLHVFGVHGGFHGDLPSLKQLRHRYAQLLCQRHQDAHIRQVHARLPFADGLVGHIQPLGQLRLGQPQEPSLGCHKRAETFLADLIHIGHLLQ